MEDAEQHSLVAAVLDDELAAARTRFHADLSQLVADFGALNNRFGSALTNALEERGINELRNRADLVLAAWRSRAARLPGERAEFVLNAANERVRAEASEIQQFISGINMGCYPVRGEFLDEQLGLTTSRLPTDVAALFATARPVAHALTARRTPSDEDARLKLLRRELFDSEIKQAVGSAMATREPLSLVFCDLDRFKSINDNHGHQIGDEVLEAAASVVRRVVGSKGACYRYGGEEITILLPNYSAAEAAALAERARVALAENQISAKRLAVTASFGVAEVPEHAKNEAELVKSADDAMYQAKKLGRNLVRVAGEAAEANSQPQPTPRRRPPTPNSLSDEEIWVIRTAYFTHEPTLCPKDGAQLDIEESNAHNRPTPNLMVYCPMCGLRATIAGNP